MYIDHPMEWEGKVESNKKHHYFRLKCSTRISVSASRRTAASGRKQLLTTNQDPFYLNRVEPLPYTS